MRTLFDLVKPVCHLGNKRSSKFVKLTYSDENTGSTAIIINSDLDILAFKRCSAKLKELLSYILFFERSLGCSLYLTTRALLINHIITKWQRHRNLSRFPNSKLTENVALKLKLGCKELLMNL